VNTMLHAPRRRIALNQFVKDIIPHPSNKFKAE